MLRGLMWLCNKLQQWRKLICNVLLIQEYQVISWLVHSLVSIMVQLVLDRLANYVTVGKSQMISNAYRSLPYSHCLLAGKGRVSWSHSPTQFSSISRVDWRRAGTSKETHQYNRSIIILIIMNKFSSRWLIFLKLYC